MKKFAFFTLGLLAFTLAACGDNNAPTDATSASVMNKTTQFQFPWGPFEVENTCCGETVTIEGTLHYVIKGDDIHVNGHKITGTSADGTTWHGNINASVKADFEDDGSGCVSHIQNFVLNKKGDNDCQMKIKIRFRACVDADGNVTVTQEVVEITCL